MPTIQEFFNRNEPKTRINIYLQGNKIGKTTGNTLIIDDYQQLEAIYISDIPNLNELIIKNCEKLESVELHLDKEIKTTLIGEFPKLKNIKTVSNQQQSIILKKDKECNCGGVRLIFESILIFLNVMLLGYIYWDKKRRMKSKN